jgi:hypothetical protein
MRDYGKVVPRFWTGSTGKALKAAGPEAVIVALYLMTSPHANMIGLYYLPMIYIAHETGLGLEGASKGLAKCIEAGFCMYDEASEHVFVLQMAKFQVGEGMKPTDNRCKGVENELSKVPKGALQSRFREIYGAAFHLEKESPSQDPSKPLRSQEQEQEQEQEEEDSFGVSSPAAEEPPPADLIGDTASAGRPCPHEAIIAAYHEALPTLPSIRQWTPARRKALQARWREDTDRQTLDWWRGFFAYVAESDFLTGRSKRGNGHGAWECSLPWLLKAENFAKVLEGHYENREAA